MIFMFTPKVGEDFQFNKHIFSDGLVQPPTIVIDLAPEKALKRAGPNTSKPKV